MTPCSLDDLNTSHAPASSLQLIDLHASAADQSANSHSSTMQLQLLQGIYQGLLNPAVELSEAAARKLQLQLSQDVLSSNSSSKAVTASSTSTSAQYGHRHASLGLPAVAAPAAGTKLRSLPVELLYDDHGLALFDQITHLPEYYLTAAEANILATHASNIVEHCMPQEGACATLVELGAGSMRKTRLLLDAVMASGRGNVTFCALDLCEQSLHEALRALQGVYQGQIQLVGLVGTYQQGLAHLQQQQQQVTHANYKPHTVGLSKTLKSTHTSDIPLEPLSTASCASTPAPCCHCMEHTASKSESTTTTTTSISSSGGSSSSNSLADEALSYLTWEDQLPLQPPGINALTLCSSSSSSLMADTADGIGGSYTGKGDDTSSPVHETAAAAMPAGSGKVILWLGSSIGNCSRAEAAAFLQQVKQAALQPGDALLVGIDRRNSSEKVHLAYNDPKGVTRDFILNGLKHCKRLLEKQQPAVRTQGAGVQPADSLLEVTSNLGSCAATPGCDGTTSSTVDNCLQLEHFAYFCLYNEELGRHEAYYQANTNTHIVLPPVAAAAAALIEAAAVGVDHKSSSLTGGVHDAALQQAATNQPLSSVVVPITAGELILIEYSHKYSRHEVGQLAATAGLSWVRAWTDKQQQYDLHMFATT